MAYLCMGNQLVKANPLPIISMITVKKRKGIKYNSNLFLFLKYKVSEIKKLSISKYK